MAPCPRCGAEPAGRNPHCGRCQLAGATAARRAREGPRRAGPTVPAAEREARLRAVAGLYAEELQQPDRLARIKTQLEALERNVRHSRAAGAGPFSSRGGGTGAGHGPAILAGVNPDALGLRSELTNLAHSAYERNEQLQALLEEQRRTRRLLEHSLEQGPGAGASGSGRRGPGSALRASLDPTKAPYPLEFVTRKAAANQHSVEAASRRAAARAIVSAERDSRPSRMLDRLASSGAGAAAKSPRRLDQAAERLLEAHSVRLAAQADTQETCCICLDRLSKGEPRMLRCSHVLHRDCLRRMLWNKSEVVCPLCKTPS